jgi:hypothetical protein
MGKDRCGRRSLLARLTRFLRRRCEDTVPAAWLDEPPPPDIVVREPRRPRPDGGAGTALSARR